MTKLQQPYSQPHTIHEPCLVPSHIVNEARKGTSLLRKLREKTADSTVEEYNVRVLGPGLTVAALKASDGNHSAIHDPHYSRRISLVKHIGSQFINNEEEDILRATRELLLGLDKALVWGSSTNGIVGLIEAQLHDPHIEILDEDSFASFIRQDGIEHTFVSTPAAFIEEGAWPPCGVFVAWAPSALVVSTLYDVTILPFLTSPIATNRSLLSWCGTFIVSNPYLVKIHCMTTGRYTSSGP